jgi:hypothetical protein
MLKSCLPGGVDVALVDPDDTGRVLEVHSLLLSSFPTGQVEDRSSFLRSVSRTADPGAVPTVVAAFDGGAVDGAVVGAYLPRVNAGMVLYSAVERRARNRGLYGAMRARLVEAIAADARDAGKPGVDYIVSEVEEDSPLHRQYVSEWRAYTAPCDYWQPETQGLSARPLKLVLQPILADGPPTARETAVLVREIYRSVYRLEDPEEEPSYRRVILSLEAGESV